MKVCFGEINCYIWQFSIIDPQSTQQEHFSLTEVLKKKNGIKSYFLKNESLQLFSYIRSEVRFSHFILCCGQMVLTEWRACAGNTCSSVTDELEGQHVWSGQHGPRGEDREGLRKSGGNEIMFRLVAALRTLACIFSDMESHWNVLIKWVTWVVIGLKKIVLAPA